jgi:hypothetical protein
MTRVARAASGRWGVVGAVFLIVSLITAGFVLAGDPPGRPTATQARLTPPVPAPGAASRTAPGGTASPNQVPARPSDAIGALLDARAAALMRGDRAGWLAPLLSSQTAFVAAQAELFDRIRVTAPREWRYQVAGGSALPPERRDRLGGVAWLAEVRLGYRLTDSRSVTTRDQYLTVVRTGPGWRIAADTDGPTARDVWDLGPVTRARSARCVVVGASARRGQIAQLADECSAAAERVDQIWGAGWARRTLLVVPADTKALATLLGSPRGSGLDATAAVTTGPADGAADGVLINADAFEQLSGLGRRVVVTHELVHVAVRATGARYAPTWLSEGLADHVAYAGTGLGAGQVAAGAVEQTRRAGPPARLPGDDAFDASTSGAEAAYDESWVAVGIIAQHTDLKRFYERAAARNAQLDRVLKQAGLGGVRAFIRLWQAELRRLAR